VQPASRNGKALGPDAVARVYRVDLSTAKIDGNFLDCFRALPELHDLSATDVSAEAVKTFQRSHSKCTIEAYGTRGGKR
jgi:hypothetical protein